MEYIGVEDGATFESIDEMVACVSAESTFDKDTADDEEVLQFDDTLLVDDVDYSNHGADFTAPREWGRLYQYCFNI